MPFFTRYLCLVSSSNVFIPKIGIIVKKKNKAMQKFRDSMARGERDQAEGQI